MSCGLRDALALIVLAVAHHEKDGLLVKGNEWVFEGVSWQYTSYYPSGEINKSEESTFTETVRVADLSRSGDSPRITLHDRRFYPTTGTILSDTLTLLLTRRDSNGYILKTSDSLRCPDLDFPYHNGSELQTLFSKDTLLADHADGKKPHVVIRSAPASILETESEYLPGTGVVAAKYRDLISSGGGHGRGYWLYHQGHFALKKFNGTDYDQVSLAIRGRRRAGSKPVPPGSHLGYDLLGRLQPPQPRIPASQPGGR